MKVLETLVEQISASFLNYLHLWTWLDQKITHSLSGRSIHEFNSVKDFWLSVFEEDIHPGDRIRFKDAFITEWFPRLPGQAWFLDHTNKLSGPTGPKLESIRNGQGFFSQSVIESNNLDPFGVVRLPFGENKLRYAGLSLTTQDSWCCDLGIPLIISSSVYDAYLQRRMQGLAVEATLEGVVQFGTIPIFHPEMLKSLGSDINRDFLEKLSSPSGIPNVYIQIASPLDTIFRIHNTHPPGFLWAIHKTVSNAIVTHSFDGREPKSTPCEPFATYGLLIAHAALNDKDEVLNFVEEFKKASVFPRWKFPSLRRRRERPERLSVDILTEFDSRNRYFASKIPLEKEPWHKNEARAEIKRILSDLAEAMKD